VESRGPAPRLWYEIFSARDRPSNIKICRRGQWNERMLIETVLS
jgi:hypothetical protein